MFWHTENYVAYTSHCITWLDVLYPNRSSNTVTARLSCSNEFQSRTPIKLKATLSKEEEEPVTSTSMIVALGYFQSEIWVRDSSGPFMLAKHLSPYFANLHMDHSLKIEFNSAFSWTGFNANQIHTQSRCYVWLKILWKYLWFWFGSSFTAIGLMIMHLGECTPRSFNFCSLWAIGFSGMLKESFDSNSPKKPGAGFVFFTKNVGSGGPPVIHSNPTLPFSSPLMIMEWGPQEGTVGVTEGDNNGSSTWIGWSLSTLWVYFIREVQTWERKFRKRQI